MAVGDGGSADGREGPSYEDGSQPGGARAEVLFIGHQPPKARRAKLMSRTGATADTGRGPRHSDGRSWTAAPVMAIAAAIAVALIGVVGLLVVAVVTESEWKRCPNDGRGSMEAQELRTLASAEFQAFVTADSSQLEHTLAPDFTLITPPGDAWSRSKLLMSIRTGELSFQTFQTPSTIEVRLNCDAAALTYRSDIDVTYGSRHYKHEARHLDLYERRDGQWLKVWAQATAVGGFPPPGQ